jgi:hypothetical protein
MLRPSPAQVEVLQGYSEVESILPLGRRSFKQFNADIERLATEAATQHRKAQTQVILASEAQAKAIDDAQFAKE